MIAVGLTDLDWFAFLRDGPARHEVNFWTPTPWGVRTLAPGDLWYFLLKAPIRKVGGWGTFARYEEVRASEAWNRYGPGNGVRDLDGLVARVHKYADARSVLTRDRGDPEIGCIILDFPVFLDDREMRPPEALGAPVPRQVVKYKTFPGLGRLALSDAPDDAPGPFDLVEGGPAHRVARVVDRPGQRRFRDRVLRAYGEACAVTGEACLEVLEAAHVQPYVDERSNDVRNGIALRADLHALFDAGLVTVDEEMCLATSPRLGSPAYRELHGAPLRMPEREADRPSAEALAFHRKAVFRDA